MMSRERTTQGLVARIFFVWGIACGGLGLAIPEPFVRVMALALMVVCGTAFFMPRLMQPIVIWFVAIASVIAMIVGYSAAGVEGLVLAIVIACNVLAPPAIGAFMLKHLYAGTHPEAGSCPRCGYSLRGLRSPRCPECGHDIRLSP